VPRAGRPVYPTATSRPRLPALGSADDHIDLSAAALGADQPRVPIRDGHLRAVALGHLGGVGLDLMAAIEAPQDQTHMGGSGVAKRAPH
jgi:hypothetical protein